MVELEQLTEFRFYKLIPVFLKKCTNSVENIYSWVDHTKPTMRMCNSHLRNHMTNGSINLKCPSCRKEYDIIRHCSSCGKQTHFDDITCDNCEPKVIDIASWKISIDEANKAIKKINRAFKQDLIKENEWKNALELNKDEIIRCEKNLKREGISLQSTN